jgi:Flp pilus assembly protein TadG
MTVEAAMVLPLILLVLLAAFEITVLAVTKLELVAAAREGARVAATVPDPARAVDAVREALDPELAAEAAVSVSRPTVSGRPVEVVVTIVRHLKTPLLSMFTVPLSGTAVMVVEP